MLKLLKSSCVSNKVDKALFSESLNILLKLDLLFSIDESLKFKILAEIALLLVLLLFS